MIAIVEFNKKYSEQFFMLNKAWIEESWHLEDSDKKDLLNPDKIVHNGGQVFFALKDHKAIGTVAMIKSSDDRFELAKMTVQDDLGGKAISVLPFSSPLTMRWAASSELMMKGMGKSLRSVRGVFTKPGETTTTSMPSAAKSARSA